MKNIKDACNSDGAFHAEFAAHCTAMNLYGFFTDLQFVSDLLIEQSPRHFLSNHLFPSRKRVKNVSVFICQLILLAALTGFGRKSVAPSLRACTAISMSP